MLKVIDKYHVNSVKAGQTQEGKEGKIDEKVLIGLVTLGTVFGAVGLAMTASTANQTVTYPVSAINAAQGNILTIQRMALIPDAM